MVGGRGGEYCNREQINAEWRANLNARSTAFGEGAPTAIFIRRCLAFMDCSVRAVGPATVATLIAGVDGPGKLASRCRANYRHRQCAVHPTDYQMLLLLLKRVFQSE